jgi:hypothetical protein
MVPTVPQSETALVTLTGDVDTITFSHDYSTVEVINVSGDNPVWFSIDSELDLTLNDGGSYDNAYLLPITTCSRKYTSNARGNTVVYLKGTADSTVAITASRLINQVRPTPPIYDFDFTQIAPGTTLNQLGFLRTASWPYDGGDAFTVTGDSNGVTSVEAPGYMTALLPLESADYPDGVTIRMSGKGVLAEQPGWSYPVYGGWTPQVTLVDADGVPTYGFNGSFYVYPWGSWGGFSGYSQAAFWGSQLFTSPYFSNHGVQIAYELEIYLRGELITTRWKLNSELDSYSGAETNRVEGLRSMAALGLGVYGDDLDDINVVFDRLTVTAGPRPELPVACVHSGDNAGVVEVLSSTGNPQRLHLLSSTWTQSTYESSITNFGSLTPLARPYFTAGQGLATSTVGHNRIYGWEAGLLVDQDTWTYRSSAFTLMVDATVPDWTPTALASLATWGNEVEGERSAQFNVNTNGTLSLVVFQDGTTASAWTATSTVPTGLVDGTRGRLAVSWDGDVDGVTEAKFWQSLDGVTWTQLGDTISAVGVRQANAHWDYIVAGQGLFARRLNATVHVAKAWMMDAGNPGTLTKRPSVWFDQDKVGNRTGRQTVGYGRSQPVRINDGHYLASEGATTNRPRVQTIAAAGKRKMVVSDGNDIMFRGYAQAQPFSLVAVGGIGELNGVAQTLVGIGTRAANGFGVNAAGKWTLQASASTSIVSTVDADTDNHCFVAYFNGGVCRFEVDGVVVAVGPAGTDALATLSILSGHPLGASASAGSRIGYLAAYTGDIANTAAWATLRPIIYTMFDVADPFTDGGGPASITDETYDGGGPLAVATTTLDGGTP